MVVMVTKSQRYQVISRWNYFNFKSHLAYGVEDTEGSTPDYTHQVASDLDERTAIAFADLYNKIDDLEGKLETKICHCGCAPKSGQIVC